MPLSTPAKKGDALLKQRAYSLLKSWIQSGVFAPGAFLSERQLATQLEMSKTPVKAAIERLEYEGFLTVAPQQGIVVRELSPQEIADHYEIRAALEAFVVRSVAGRLTQQDLEKLRANLDAAVEAADVGQAMQVDAEFHLLLCEVLG